MSHADEPAKGGKLGSVTEVTYDSIIDQCIVAPDEFAKAFLRALERIADLERTVLVAARGIDVLRAELARFVPVDDPFETFTASDGCMAIRGRSDLYERKERG